jgi:transcriptional regulator with XRE-family HTH domain
MTPARADRSTTATKIARRRVELDVSREALAEATGISLKTLQRIECGESTNPTVRQLYAIAVALGSTPSALVEEGWLARGVKRLAAPG